MYVVLCLWWADAMQAARAARDVDETGRDAGAGMMGYGMGWKWYYFCGLFIS